MKLTNVFHLGMAMDRGTTHDRIAKGLAYLMINLTECIAIWH